VFSAKGAAFMLKAGTTSQDSAGAKWPALKARFTFNPASIYHQAGTTSDLDERYVWN
jgi:hypothetical protein